MARALEDKIVAFDICLRRILRIPYILITYQRSCSSPHRFPTSSKQDVLQLHSLAMWKRSVIHLRSGAVADARVTLDFVLWRQNFSRKILDWPPHGDLPRTGHVRSTQWKRLRSLYVPVRERPWVTTTTTMTWYSYTATCKKILDIFGTHLKFKIQRNVQFFMLSGSREFRTVIAVNSTPSLPTVTLPGFNTGTVNAAWILDTLIT